MKREIKFRFWSGDKMFYDLENVFECLKQQCSFDAGFSLPVPYDHVGLHGASFMQFTGLRDKNGVEIYEGDVFLHNNRRFYIVFSENRFMFVARLCGTGAGTKNASNWRDLCWVNNVSKYIEVIGNIYEHPELLGSAGM